MEPKSHLKAFLAIIFPWVFIGVMVVLILTLTSCAGLPGSSPMSGIDLEQIGVDTNDNAILVICGEFRPSWTDTTATYKRVEAGTGYDLTQIKPEDFKTLTECPR